MTAFASFLFRIVVGGIFLIAGLAKISDSARFLLSLREFQLFPSTIERFLAVYLPWLEFVLGFFIMTGLLYRTASILLAVLSGIFTLAIISVMARGIVVDCGCFGLMADILKIPDAADIKAVVRNLIFIGMCVYVAAAKKSAFSLEGFIRSR